MVKKARTWQVNAKRIMLVVWGLGVGVVRVEGALVSDNFEGYADTPAMTTAWHAVKMTLGTDGKFNRWPVGGANYMVMPTGTLGKAWFAFNATDTFRFTNSVWFYDSYSGPASPSAGLRFSLATASDFKMMSMMIGPPWDSSTRTNYYGVLGGDWNNRANPVPRTRGWHSLMWIVGPYGGVNTFLSMTLDGSHVLYSGTHSSFQAGGSRIIVDSLWAQTSIHFDGFYLDALEMNAPRIPPPRGTVVTVR